MKTEETEFIFESFDEAMVVHKKLFNIMREKGLVTYADLHSLYTKEHTNCKDEWLNYGWTNIWGAVVEPADNYINGNWRLKLPKMKHLNRKGE